MRNADLSMVVPTYNERDRLEELVRDLFATAERSGIALEVVIVDDSSPDGTGELADALARVLRIRVIHRSGKLGLGTAVVEGIRASHAEIVGVMDADLSHPPSLVPRMLCAFTSLGADVVVASRYVPGGSSPGWPLRRRALSRLACALARGVTPVRDATSGFFLIRRSVASGVRIRAGGFKICLELVVRGELGALVEVPYRFDDRTLGESKMSLREAAGYLVQLKDLYLFRLVRRGPATAYRRVSSEELERFVRAAE